MIEVNERILLWKKVADKGKTDATEIIIYERNKITETYFWSATNRIKEQKVRYKKREEEIIDDEKDRRKARIRRIMMNKNDQNPLIRSNRKQINDKKKVMEKEDSKI